MDNDNNSNIDIALLKQETQYIKEWVARLEKKQDEQHNLLYGMVKEMIDWLPKQFVTREEIEPIKQKQKAHDDIISRVWWGALITLISLIGWFIWLTKYM